MLVVAEGRRPYCYSCGASARMSKACPGKNAAIQPNQASVAEAVEESGKAPMVFWGRWGRKDGKRQAPSPSRMSCNHNNHRSGQGQKSCTNRCPSPQKNCNKQKNSNIYNSSKNSISKNKRATTKEAATTRLPSTKDQQQLQQKQKQQQKHQLQKQQKNVLRGLISRWRKCPRFVHLL